MKQAQYTVEREFSCRIGEKDMVRNIIRAHTENQYRQFPPNEKKQEDSK